MPSMNCDSSISVDARDLSAADGLLILITRALDKLKPGDTLEILSDNASTQHDLSACATLDADRWLGTGASNGRWCHRIEKGPVFRGLADQELDWGSRGPIKDGRFDTRNWLLGRAGEIQRTAQPSDGFAPRGASVEEGSPEFEFDVLERNRAWSHGAAEFYEQATAGHWDASRDIPWRELHSLAAYLDVAICQFRTFLAEIEFSAFSVPAKWIARIQPHYAETVFFHATQVRDEARHIEVFVKRALANGGGLQFSSASTQA